MVPTDVGQVVAGRFELTARIGSGGMGTVWRAHDRVLRTDVALKEMAVLSDDLGDDLGEVNDLNLLRERSTQAAQAVREARNAVRLRGHPNIVSVFDVVTHGDQPWIVMELVAARPLHEVVHDDGPMPPWRAAQVGSQVASALAFAGQNGVVHRDVKPANILVADDGAVKLADFGIARADTDTLITRGKVGTLAYMAPECRLDGKPATAASDVFSLGATLYYLVEGELVPMSVVARGSRLRLARAGELVPVLLAMLALDPADRPSASGARDQLARLAGDGSPDGPAGTPGESTAILAQSGPIPAPRVANPVSRPDSAPATDAPPPGEPPSNEPANQRGTPGADGSPGPDDPPKEDKEKEPDAAAGAPELASPLERLERLDPPVPAESTRGSGGRPRGWAKPLAAVAVALVLGTVVFLASLWKGSGNVSLARPIDQGTADSDRGGATDDGSGSPAPDGSSDGLGRTGGSGGSGGSQATVTVPDVEGLATSEAERALRGAGLGVGYTDPVMTDAVAVNHVVTQSPNPGARVTAGSRVTLTLSTAPGDVLLPDVVGMSEADARNTLTSAGFAVQVTNERSDDYPRGQAVRTSPSYPERRARGSSVMLVVSSGPNTVVIPANLAGQTAAAARQSLEDLELVVANDEHAQSEDVPAGNVIRSNPAGGQRVPVGSTVTLVVSDGRAVTTIPVPNVIGLSQAAAVSELERVGLVPVVSGTSCLSCLVTSTDPAAGALVEERSRVTLYLDVGVAY